MGMIDNTSACELAIREIQNTYGDLVSIDAKAKSLNKFGRNDNLGTSFETVWLQGGMETYPTTNSIDSISSGSAGDTQEVVVEGHTISGGDLTFEVQTVTLAGQTKTPLATPLYRANRVYNNASTDFAGTVYVYEDDTVSGGVPDTSAKIHLQTDGTNNQSLKAATSLASSDYWLATAWTCGVTRQQTRSVDFRLQVRDAGKVFRTRAVCTSASNSGSTQVLFDPVLILPKNADIRVIAASSGTGTGVTSTIHGYLAKTVTERCVPLWL